MLLVFVSSLIFVVSCGPEPYEIERIMEDGVEVVIDHTKPYKIKGEASRNMIESLPKI